jgi:hypothetical protein
MYPAVLEDMLAIGCEVVGRPQGRSRRSHHQAEMIDLRP